MTETLVGQFPKHIGSTGGLLNSAETEEKYAIVWKSAKEQAFELPTGGAAIMHEGDNLMYFARKEQCLALGTQLRAFKPRIEDFKIYRIFRVVILNSYIQKTVFSLRKSMRAEKKSVIIQGE